MSVCSTVPQRHGSLEVHITSMMHTGMHEKLTLGAIEGKTQHSTAQHSAAQNVAQISTAQHSAADHNMLKTIVI